jgi:replicative DNA helicase
MLKDSKTGKQGAADIIVTIGAVNDPVLASSRYIGTTKNKRVRTGVPGSPMQEVIFRGDKARYEEIA